MNFLLFVIYLNFVIYYYLRYQKFDYNVFLLKKNNNNNCLLNFQHEFTVFLIRYPFQSNCYFKFSKLQFLLKLKLNFHHFHCSLSTPPLHFSSNLSMFSYFILVYIFSKPFKFMNNLIRYLMHEICMVFIVFFVSQLVISFSHFDTFQYLKFFVSLQNLHALIVLSHSNLFRYKRKNK